MLSITLNDLECMSEQRRKALALFILDDLATNLELGGDPEHATIPSFSEHVENEEAGETPSPESAFGNAASPAPADNERLDKSGLPWDERIHASTRTKNADGQWKRKRGIDEATVTQVEAELRQLMAIPSPAPLTVTEVPQPAPSQETPAASAPGPVLVPAPPAPAPAANPAQSDFIALVQRCTQLVATGKLKQEELTAAVNGVGVPALPMLASRPDLIPQVSAAIDATIIGR